MDYRDIAIKTLIILVALYGLNLFNGTVRKFIVRRLATLNGGLANFVDTKLTFIGILHHELAHAIMALVTGASVEGFTLMQRGNTLGQVKIKPRGPKLLWKLQLSLSATAPLTLGMVTLYIIKVGVLDKYGYETWQFWTATIASLQIAYHMNLSKQDIKVALSGIVYVAGLIGLIVYVFSIDITTLRDYFIYVIVVQSVNFGMIILMFMWLRILKVVGGWFKG